jgi:hypothetical protein
MVTMSQQRQLGCQVLEGSIGGCIPGLLAQTRRLSSASNLSTVSCVVVCDHPVTCVCARHLQKLHKSH